MKVTVNTSTSNAVRVSSQESVKVDSAAERGPAGPQGSQGPQGSSGGSGPPGPPGNSTSAAAFRVWTSSANSVAVSSNTAKYLCVMIGGGGGGGRTQFGAR